MSRIDLQNELAKLKDRQSVIERLLVEYEKRDPIQIPSKEIDWSDVLEACKEQMEDHKNNPYNGEERDSFFEIVMETVYGASIWQWWNEQ